MTINKYDFNKNEKKEVESDYQDLIKLLQVRFDGVSGKKDSQENRVIQRIGERIEDDFLNSRGSYFAERLCNNVSLKKEMQCINDLVCTETPKCSECVINKYCNHYIKNEILKVDSKSPKFIDLFCGAGGLSLGFKQEGYVLNLANDIDSSCISTYTHNHPETPRKHIILSDIDELIDNIDNLLRFSKTDLVIGGPPCQGFSMANRQRLIDDPRNKLYKSYVRIVDIVKPKFFVMENVKGMLSVADQVKEDFNKIGYLVSAKVLNAKDFGIPQNRERLIFIGNRVSVDNDMIFEEIDNYALRQKDFTLSDALYGLKPLKASRKKNATQIDDVISGEKISSLYTSRVNEYIKTINLDREMYAVMNHKARYNNDRDIEIFGRLNQGDKSDDPKIADIMPYSNRNHIFKDKYFKLENDKVCKTITAHMKFDCNMYIHPTQARGLTPREAARVQSYPDDYYFKGAYTKTYMQIGNAVPPLLGRAIAKILKPYIGEDIK